MSEVIRFLETMGRAPLSAGDYAAAVAALEVEQPQRAALLDRDHAALGELLGGRSLMFFGVFAPEEAPLEDEPVREVPPEPVEPAPED